MTDHTMSDAQAVLHHVRYNPPGAPHELEAGKSYLVVVDGQRHLIDTRSLDPKGPRRPAGTVVATTPIGFVAAVTIGDVGRTVIYSDSNVPMLSAVLNDDNGNEAGWRDRRVEWRPRRTPEWEHWLANQGLKSQAEFADVIEEGLPELRSPSAAAMLDLAQTFQATTSARFRQQGKLASGARQFLYEEDVEAKAGTAGEVSIPEEFVLEVTPFRGAAPVEIRARLKYRLREGQLTIGYQLVRPHEVEQVAFDALAAGAVADLDMADRLIDGTPPPPAQVH